MVRQFHREQSLGGAPDAAHVALELRIGIRVIEGRQQLARGGDDALLRLAQAVAQRGEFDLRDLAARRRYGGIDALENVAARRQRPFERAASRRVGRILDEHFAIADDEIERRAQLVPQLGHRLGGGEPGHSGLASSVSILPNRRSSSTGFVS